jgi:hypothetical protein
MSGSIKKVQSMVAFPKNKYDNQLYFNVGMEDGQIDMKSSYVELELTLDGVNNYRNVVLGQDGLYYNASALFRDAKLTESRSGKNIADLMYVNVLSNNLEYFSKGANNVIADALYDGKGHASNDASNNIVSVFNNAYPDAPYPVVRCPLSLLYPGSIGDADLFPQQDELTFRYYLEPQFNVFMRAVKTGVYDVGTQSSTSYAFGNVNLNTTSATAGAVGTVGNFAVNQYVVVSCIQNAVHVSLIRQITAITPDAGGNPGSITFNIALSTTQASSVVTVKDISNTDVLACIPVNATANSLTLAQTYAVGLDLDVGTSVHVNYNTVSAAGVVSSRKRLTTKVSAVSGTPIQSITLADSLTLAAGEVAINISVVPLYTNLTANWTLQNAHMIMYRRNVPMSHQAKMLASNFSSVNVAMVGGLNRFMYSIKAPQNAYNVYVLTPDATNLFSVATNLQDYLISVDDVPLTSIYVDSSGSAVQKDNLIRVLSNSPYYQPKNLDHYRDKEIIAEVKPNMFVGKVFHSLNKGDPNVQPMDGMDRNIKVELVAADGSSTPAKMVYIFLEKWDEV